MKIRESILIAGVIAIGLVNILLRINLQGIAQGDHGRDLYCFLKVLEGQMPIRDFDWIYGPLMPYYYAFWYKVLGVSILSVKIGESLLIFLCILSVYLLSREVMPPVYSFLSSLYFTFSYTATYLMVVDKRVYTPIRHTYNHIGGTLAIILSLYLLVRFIKSEKTIYLLVAGISTAVLMGIKLNIGVAFVVAFSIYLLLMKRWKDSLLYSLLSILMAFIIYTPFIWQVNSLSRSFPYSSSQHQHFGSIFFFTFRPFLERAGFFRTILNLVSYTPFLGLLSLGISIIMGIKGGSYKIFLLFFLTFLFLSHEYLLASSIYSLDYFCLPGIAILLILPLAIMKNKARYPLLVFFVFAILYNMIDGNIRLQRRDKYFLPFPRAKIYSLNEPGWLQVVYSTTSFLQKNTEKDEYILAIPYMPFYYFLSERESATRSWSFVKMDNLSKEDDDRVIKDIEAKKVRYILISDEAFFTGQKEAGIFGKTHEKRLWDYINKNYKAIKVFGDWGFPGDWLGRHSIAVMRRDTPFGK